MQRIVVVGGGFAGLWSAVGAMRALAKSGRTDKVVEVTLVSKDGYLTNRPRLYEADPNRVRIPLDDLLGPLGVRRVEGTVTDIDLAGRQVVLTTDDGVRRLTYDRLVLAAGSRLHRPAVPGLQEYGFSVDTYQEAMALQRHVAGLPGKPPAPGRFAAVVVGSGLTGLETAAEMVTRLRRVAEQSGREAEAQVVLVERASRIAEGLGEEARAVVMEALDSLGIAVRTGTGVAAVQPDGVVLETGDFIPAATTIWTGGLRANPLTERFPVERDPLGRLPVDQFLRVQGVDGVFAAGDVAHARCDEEHFAVMSCQHAVPQGKFAGYNAACDLLGQPLVPYEHRSYVTCVDLGEWGALFTVGWVREVVHQGASAKHLRQVITRYLIDPSLFSRPGDLLREADVEGFRRTDRMLARRVIRWAFWRIPPAFVHFCFRWRTAWSGELVVQTESLSTAFLVLLESLSPLERSVFLLRQVFEYGYAEIARMVGKSETYCRQLFHRARKHIATGRPRFEADPGRAQEMVERFVQACTAGDMDGLLSLLATDVTSWSDGGGKATAARRPIQGALSVARFLLGIARAAGSSIQMRTARVNGLPGIVIYHGERPVSVISFQVADGRIQQIFLVVNPDKLKTVPWLPRPGTNPAPMNSAK